MTYDQITLDPPLAPVDDDDAPEDETFDTETLFDVAPLWLPRDRRTAEPFRWPSRMISVAPNAWA